MKKFLFNKYLIKKPSSLIHALKKIGEQPIEIIGDESVLFDIFKITDTKTSVKELLNLILDNRKNIRSIVNYLQNNTDDIDINRLLKYIEYRKTNPFGSNNEVVLKLMYGNERGIELFKKQQTKFSKYYTVEYYIDLGFSYDDALIKVNEFKDNKSTKMENFIKKYGEVIGVEKYNDYVNKSKNTIKTFKERYGESWEDKWLNYTKKDSSSYEWALKKSEMNVELANKIFNDKLKKTTITLDFLIQKYGEIDGNEKWIEMNKLKDSSSLNFFIKKYGDNEFAFQKYKECAKLKDSSSLKFFVKKYGENGFRKYKDKCRKSDCNSMRYYISKYNETGIAYKKYIEGQIKRKVKILRASKSSLVYFKPLYDFLINKDVINNNDIYLGIDGSKEYFIKDERCVFFYDFTILSKKIIIEFNGKAWHPNWEKYGLIECKQYFNNKNINVDLAIKKDINKINLAKRKGFDVLILWEEDGIDINMKKLYNYFLDKGIKYEN